MYKWRSHLQLCAEGVEPEIVHSLSTKVIRQHGNDCTAQASQQLVSDSMLAHEMQIGNLED